MSHLTKENGFCPNCGFDNASPVNEPHQLECRSILAGAYLIGCVLGQGGFGITYTGWDLNLDIKIAIKEYYPLGFAARDSHTHVSVLSLGGDKKEYYQKGLERFVNEAKTLAQLTRDNGIVGVRGFLRENGTAYIIMDFVEGVTLKSLAEQRGGKLPAQEVLGLFRPLCDSLARVHAAGLLHRDISPDNIILRPNGTLTLIDFGAARQISAYGEHSNTINVKHGFAPEEQYRTHGEQGPWSDIYALCATMYRLMTGQTPPQALDRLGSGAAITPPRQLGAALTPAQENALLHGLGVNAQFRIRDMQSLIKELYGEAAAAPRTATGGEFNMASSAAASYTGSQPFYPPTAKKQDKKSRIKTIAIIAGSAVCIYLLILLGVGAFRGDKQEQEAQGGQFAVAAAGTAAADKDKNATPMPDATEAPTPEPTKIPDPDELYLTLDYGQMYLCSVEDFETTYDISNDEVEWTSNDTDIVSVTRNGIITAGYVQADLSEGYNDYVSITGEAPNGVEFTYEVAVGNGSTYDLDWSSGPRTLRDSSGYTYVASPNIPGCTGLTLDLKYEAVTGTYDGEWVFWVHDANGEWISFPHLQLENNIVSTYELTFDHPMTINEVVMQPVFDYSTKAFEYYTYYWLSNIVFEY